MRVSHRVQYAVRAVFDIAHQANGDRPAQLREVAGRQAIPPPFLEQICRQLCRAGILTGRRGPGGGYLMARDPSAVTIADIVRAVEGQRAFEIADRERGAARRVSERLWSDLGAAMGRALGSVTVRDLCERAERGGVPPRGSEPYHYFI
jgi:Rrf2 family iron-sulfur cluster assembly transcriptional regulator